MVQLRLGVQQAGALHSSRSAKERAGVELMLLQALPDREEDWEDLPLTA